MGPFEQKLSVITIVVLLVSLCSACREPAVKTHAFSHSVQDYDPELDTIEMSPVESTCVAKSYALLVASVKGKDGTLQAGKRIEWIIASESGGVGDIVKVDESGLFLADRGTKWNNTFAVTYTNQFDHDLEKAKGGGPDIETLLGQEGHGMKILRGQTWIIISSPVGGVTRVVAYAPGIEDTDKQRAYSTVYWFDAQATFPEPSAICKIGTPHQLACTVKRISDGEPLKGFPVRWTVAEGGPEAYFVPGNKNSVVTFTDELGIASASLCQTKPTIGRNSIEVAALFPKSEDKSVGAMWSGRVGVVTITREWCSPILRMAIAGPDVVHEQDAADYTITISNEGKVSSENTALRVVLPDGVSYLSSHPAGHARGKEVVWDLKTLESRAAKKIVFAAKMNEEGDGVIRGGLTCNEGVSVDSQMRVNVIAPHLTISKTGPATLLRGTQATYKITVKSVGTASATNVVVTENVPPGFKAKEETHETVWRIGTLAPGKSVEKEYTYIAEREGKCTHDSIVTADRGVEEEAEIVTIVTAPQLALTVSGPEKRYVQQKLRYEIVVTNTGTAPASHVVITNKLPPEFRFIAAGANGEFEQTSDTVTWSMLGVPPGERSSVDVTVRAEHIGKFVNTATASADDGLFAKGEAVTTVEGIAALRMEMYDLYDPVEIGGVAEYIVNIINQGTSSATQVTLSGSFPREMEFVAGEGPTTVEKRTGGFMCEPIDTLQPGTKATYRLMLKVLAPKDARFEISLSAKELGEPISEQESTRIIE